MQHKAWANPSGGKNNIYIYIQTFFTQFFAHCGETSAWPGTCANFNPRNLAPPKHHARLRCASFGWHVRQRKSYPHGQAMPQKHWSKNAKVLGQKKLCWKCWGKKVCAGHASHTLAHCFQEMSTCIIADRWRLTHRQMDRQQIDKQANRHTDRQE